MKATKTVSWSCCTVFVDVLSETHQVSFYRGDATDSDGRTGCIATVEFLPGRYYQSDPVCTDVH